MLQQAELFAQRLRRESGEDLDQQIEKAYWLCYSRGPTADERTESKTFVHSAGLPAFCRAMLNSNEFVFLQ